MHPSIPSVALVTSINMINAYRSDIINFFLALNYSKKDLLIYTPQAITDYSSIQALPADEVIELRQKDFLPFNLLLRPPSLKALKQRHYHLVIHFNTEQYQRNTFLIAKAISGKIKLSDNLNHARTFSVILYNSDKYLAEVISSIQKFVI